MEIESELILDGISTINPTCDIHIVHARVKVDERATTMMKTIMDTSWISRVEDLLKGSYEANMNRSVEMLKKIIIDSEGHITKEFGQYLIPMTAQDVLELKYGHKKIVLAEIFKPRKSGNEGFDFHTISHKGVIVFGEAKYRRHGTKHTEAIEQAVEFIKDKKDESDFPHLVNLIDRKLVEKAKNGKKSYSTATSMETCVDLDEIKELECFKELTKYEEVYLIGVIIDDR